jgi:hypothetical protein
MTGSLQPFLQAPPGPARALGRPGDRPTNAYRWAALAGGLAVLWLTSPPAIPLCGFHWLTGRPCPLCGLTRAFFALARGQWAEALHWHALSPLAAVMLLALLWNPRRMARLWMPCAAVFGVYGLWRIVF